jgi:hypothetical protein
VAGILGVLPSSIKVWEANAPTDKNAVPMSTTILSALAGAIKAIRNYLVSKKSIDHQIVNRADNIVKTLVMVNKGVFSNISQVIGKSETTNTKIKIGDMSPDDPRGVEALADSALVIPRLVITQWQFYEFFRKHDSIDRSAAIIGEVSSLADCVTRLLRGRKNRPIWDDIFWLATLPK